MYTHYSKTRYRTVCGDTVPDIAITNDLSLVNCPRCVEALCCGQTEILFPDGTKRVATIEEKLQTVIAISKEKDVFDEECDKPFILQT